MKLTNEICISFLRGSGWLYNHDKEITISESNKAIDDFVKMAYEELLYSEGLTEIDIDYIAGQLKAGNNNGS